ncbi:hypothetical protein CTI12_AA017720 [Artemisia annua]|uniref:Uncharacterized protein n=1 Tax=Artemisia annua TaxID=35608 RepID=A0A2U1QKG8_ARTAN|nr:hypothetical protein CTI12_AA017720 [Artemisia annua]
MEQHGVTATPCAKGSCSSANIPDTSLVRRPRGRLMKEIPNATLQVIALNHDAIPVNNILIEDVDPLMKAAIMGLGMEWSYEFNLKAMPKEIALHV